MSRRAAALRKICRDAVLRKIVEEIDKNSDITLAELIGGLTRLEAEIPL
jgi:hypothetical protein